MQATGLAEALTYIPPGPVARDVDLGGALLEKLSVSTVRLSGAISKLGHALLFRAVNAAEHHAIGFDPVSDDLARTVST